MNNFSEFTWKDLFLEAFPPIKKDKSFSGFDIIRFYKRNLTWHEQDRVKNYFKRFCPKTFELPKPPEPPSLPPPPVLLPPVVIYLPGPYIPPPALPPPPPPPKTIIPLLHYPLFLLPVWPFIIPSLLPTDIIDYLLDELSEAFTVPAAEAADVEPEVVIPVEEYKLSYQAHPAEFKSYDEWQAFLSQNDTEMSQNETEIAKIVPQNETDILFPWQIQEYERAEIRITREELIHVEFEKFWYNLVYDYDDYSFSFEEYFNDVLEFGTFAVWEAIDFLSPSPEVIWIDYGEGRISKQELDGLYNEYSDIVEESVLEQLLYGENL